MTTNEEPLWRIAFAFERIAATLEQHTAAVERQVDVFEKTAAAQREEFERRHKWDADKLAPNPSEPTSEQKLEVATDALRFVCLTISNSESVGQVQAYGSRACALNANANYIVERCRAALDIIEKLKQ